MGHQCLKNNVKLILKSYSCTALAYLKSEFFKISLKHAKEYKIIQNLTRNNEDHYHLKDMLAGPKFLSDTKELA